VPPKINADRILAVLARSPKSWFATLVLAERTGYSLTVVSARLHELAERGAVEQRESIGDSHALSHEWRFAKRATNGVAA